MKGLIFAIFCSNVSGLVHVSTKIHFSKIPQSVASRTFSTELTQEAESVSTPDELEAQTENESAPHFTPVATDESWTRFYKIKAMDAEAKKPASFGFTKPAEVLNGRLAMFTVLVIAIRESFFDESIPMMLMSWISEIDSFGSVS